MNKGHVRIPSGHRHTRMSNRVAYLFQRSAAGEGVADEGLPPVVNGQMPQTFFAERAACLQESPPQRERYLAGTISYMAISSRTWTYDGQPN